MRARVVQQIAPDHWAPIGQVHYPRRCPLCLVGRVGLWLGLIVPEDDEPLEE
jgi:hypothetical protein